MSSGTRVTVQNPSDGGLVYWLVRLYAFAALSVVMAVLSAGVGLYVHFARQLPPLPDLGQYARSAPGVTALYAQDGTRIAEFANERREVVSLDQIPEALCQALVATEDRRFYVHGGIDLRGLIRALVTNLRAGQVTQGGSTITQQVAKSYLGSERTFSRKIREAIFSRRLEARYGKREILALYLNHMFLGAGAFGVQAAAHRYFDADVWELDLGQLALLAGLARAPSRDNPFVDLKAARARRNDVLNNMVEAGYLSTDEAKRWKATPIEVHPRRDDFHLTTPYFSETVRRELVKRFGQKGLYDGAFRVETTIVPVVDVAAQENVDAAVRKLDKRQGWRGPEAHLDDRRAAIFRARAASYYGPGPLEEGRLYLGLVDKVQADGALVRVGGAAYRLPLTEMSWAAPYSKTDATNDKTIDAATAALRRNDVVWVRPSFRTRVGRFSEFTYDALGESAWLPEQQRKAPKVQELALEQTPRVSGAIYSFDHQTGYVLAMAGGDDYDRSEFNRVNQACRQPGSAYKPIYYSLGLDRGYSFDTQWPDRPRAEVDPDTGQLYLPQNIDGSYNLQVSLERALVWSKNPPSVEIFHALATTGAREVEAWAKRLGISTPLVSPPRKKGERDCGKEFCPALALGASCVRLDEITKAFAVFARNGSPIEPVTIRRLYDRSGVLLEDHAAWEDAFLSSDDRLDRLAAQAAVVVPPSIEPRTAWLTSRLLREIVTQGHSAPIRATKVVSAGKTGTSSHTWDVWFIGYTSRWMTTAWIGDDEHERQLGYKDASFMLSVPMWARFMYAMTKDQPLAEIPWERPPGVKPQDQGGPLKPGVLPPPTAGFGIDGKPLTLPSRGVDGQPIQTGAPPGTLVRPQTVRVQSAMPKGATGAPTPVDAR